MAAVYSFWTNLGIDLQHGHGIKEVLCERLSELFILAHGGHSDVQSNK